MYLEAGEAGETVRHRFVALMEKHILQQTVCAYRERYKECVRLLSGLEKTLERKSSRQGPSFACSGG